MDEFEPLDNASERIVLAGIFSYGEDTYLDVADFLNPECFTDRANQALYKCFRHLIETKEIKSLDESSVYGAAQELSYQWLFDKTDELRHVRAIFNSNVKQENVPKWAAKLSKLHIARTLRKQLQGANVSLSELEGDEPVNHILGIAENAIFDMSFMLNDPAGGSNRPRRLGEGLDEYLDYIEANPVEMIGISTGYPIYDKAIGGGFRRKTVNLIGARTGVGKSMLADNMGLNITANKIPVLYIDTEMASEDHWHRCLANLSEKSATITEIETGKYAQHNYKQNKVRAGAKILKDLPYDYINVSGKPFEETLSIMRRWIHQTVGFDDNGRTKDCIILYDYLKLMSGENMKATLAEYQVLGFMATALHNFTVRHDIGVGAFTQLNKDGIDKESTSVIAGSDRVLWLTTSFAIFKPKSPEEIAADGPTNGNRKLVPLKYRHGEGLPPDDYINMEMLGKYGSITELKTKDTLLAESRTNSGNDNSSITADDIPFDEVNDDTIEENQEEKETE
jgi:replicative DNA helicase